MINYILEKGTRLTAKSSSEMKLLPNYRKKLGFEISKETITTGCCSSRIVELNLEVL